MFFKKNKAKNKDKNKTKNAIEIVFISSAIFFLLLLPEPAQAYADFIGYGYRNCAVCHVSSAGGGALTDYGRALFATEIAAKPPWIQTDDETLGEYSNFLGGVSLPWWVRLGYKYRALTVETNPGSSASQTRYHNMQNDLNTAFFMDKKQTWSLISTLSYVESPMAMYPNTAMSSDQYLFWKEYYLKYKINREYTLYTGMMDKTFGIRHPDHTANNRVMIGLGQNDQVHGLMLHRAQATSDVFVHAWMGNAQATSENQMAGGSFMYEQEVAEQVALGGNLLYETGDDKKRILAASHVKKGFKNGNSLIGELGFSDFSGNIDSKELYIFSQGHLKLVRGLFIESTGEYTKNIEMVPEKFRWTLGFLWFPVQRIELRASARQTKLINTPQVAGDSWYYLTQIHLSL